MHLVPALFPTETFGSVEISRKQTYSTPLQRIMLLISTPLASLKHDSCLHYKQTPLAVEGDLDVATSTPTHALKQIIFNNTKQISRLK